MSERKKSLSDTLLGAPAAKPPTGLSTGSVDESRRFAAPFSTLPIRLQAFPDVVIPPFIHR
jgi:hypothetical protein